MTDAGGGVATTAQQVAGQAQQLGQQAKDQAMEKTQEARQQAGGRVREQLDERTTQAGEQVSSIAETARRVGDQLRQDGNSSQAQYANQAADRMERLGGYLRQADADTLISDIEDFGRRQPVALAAGGLVLGLLAARFLKASSSQRASSRMPDYRGQTSYGAWEQQLPSAAQIETTPTTGLQLPTSAGAV